MTYQSVLRLPKLYRDCIERERELLAKRGREAVSDDLGRKIKDSGDDSDSSGIEQGDDIMPRPPSQNGSITSGDTEGPEEDFNHDQVNIFKKYF